MKTAYLLIASMLTATATLAGCSVDRLEPVEEDADQGYYFSGYVYDGVSAEKLTGYELTLTYDAAIDEFTTGEGGASGVTKVLKATVGSNGRYRVGPLKPNSDFTVEITASGYRSFTSHNPMRSSLPGGADQQRTELFEAYLFPTDIESPAVTFELFSAVDASRPSGSVRLVPTNGNAQSALSLQNTLSPSVNNQLWFNDDDARNATVVKSFEDGELSIEAGELVYGVTYTGTFFGVDGHQYQNISFTAGLSGNQSVILSELSETPLTLVGSTIDDGSPNADGTVVFTFNRPIQFWASQSEGLIAEIIDDNFSIYSPDADGDADVNMLSFDPLDDEPDAQEHGTSIRIRGNELTLSWSRDDALFATEDADDPIVSVTYGGLNQILVQSTTGTPTSVSLSTLLGAASVEVYLIAEPSL